MRHTPLVAAKYNRQNRTENPLEMGGGGGDEAAWGEVGGRGGDLGAFFQRAAAKEAVITQKKPTMTCIVK